MMVAKCNKSSDVEYNASQCMQQASKTTETVKHAVAMHSP